jgi:hypothetical protein
MSNQIELVNGTINIEDIPLIKNENKFDTYSRMSIWLIIIIIGLIIIIVISINKINEQKQLKYITTELLMEKRQALIKRGELLQNKIQIPNAKSITINIPKNSFPNITMDKLVCLFTFYVTYNDNQMVKLKGNWTIYNDNIQVLLVLPNYVKLSSLVIHTIPQQIFINNWNETFKSFNIFVRDNSDKILWNDTIIIDFNTGDSTAGYIGEGYIPIQFNLDK